MPIPPSGPVSGPAAILNRGLAAHREGRLEEAEKHYRAALRLDKRIGDAHNLLASVLSARGKHQDALDAAKRAVKIDPERAAFQYTLGNAWLAVGHAGRARDAYRRAAAKEPDSPAHVFGLGIALERLGDLDGAEEAYRRCIELSPSDPRAYVNLGHVHLRRNALEDAAETLEKAIRIAPGMVPAWLNLAAVRREMGDADGAVECYRRATDAAPRDAHVHTSHGQLLRELGRADEAIAVLRRAIECAPDKPEPRITLAMTQRHRERDDDVAWIEDLARDPDVRGAQKWDAWFAHAKVLGDLGETDRAFDEMLRANAARRESIEYDLADDAARFARIREVFSKERVAELEGLGSDDPTPILVIGMPRSGTTLVEQVLSSHPKAVGAGETMYAATVLGSELFPGGYPEAFATCGPEALRLAGERYVELLRRVSPDAERIVDKLPMNFFRLGGLRAILPNAKVIHCLRDPRDTCLSIFEQNFTGELWFAWDLAEIGRYYRLYEELMEHWRAVFGPDAFLEVVYEDVVQDLEAEARRMLDHVGLPWDPAVLDFHTTHRSVRTASLQQVRQPIYRSSVQKWRRHEARLGPLLQALGDRD